MVGLAHDLGAEKVLYIAGWRIFGTEQAQAWDWSLQAVREIAGYAADKGVTISSSRPRPTPIWSTPPARP